MSTLNHSPHHFYGLEESIWCPAPKQPLLSGTNCVWKWSGCSIFLGSLLFPALRLQQLQHKLLGVENLCSKELFPWILSVSSDFNDSQKHFMEVLKKMMEILRKIWFKAIWILFITWEQTNCLRRCHIIVPWFYTKGKGHAPTCYHKTSESRADPLSRW